MKGFQSAELSQVIAVDSKKCKGCDSCKSYCPTRAIEGKYGAVHSIANQDCIFCGQCLVNCPFGAPTDIIDSVEKVLVKLRDPQTTVVATIAPAVRIAIGEEFGFEPGTLLTKKLYGAMKQAGFKVLDTNFTADQTIMEEGYELVARIRRHLLQEQSSADSGPLPQFTSCCPAWVRYVELNHPQLIPYLSSAKSPMMMAGALAKTYGVREVWKTEPEHTFVVGVMPCTAKKFEASRPEFHSAAAYWRRQGRDGDYPDVDLVLTTRDLARLLKERNINLWNVSEFSDADNPLVNYSGAGTIFGNTGGVMEAALRTAYFVLTGQEMKTLEYKPVRGLEGFKEATLTIRDAETDQDIRLSVAVVHGIRDNIAPVIEQTLSGKSPYQFIEVMNCPGGCVNGGGQPVYPMGTSWLSKAKAILPWN
ncbi:MAG: [FeFe] hydrogenase, group A [Veillonellales bacterium]